MYTFFLVLYHSTFSCTPIFETNCFELCTPRTDDLYDLFPLRDLDLSK